MTEATGVVSGLVVLWKSCVQIFDVIDATKNQNKEHELARVKLDFERVRLDSWGAAIGLRSLDGTNTAELRPDSTILQGNVASVTTRLLGCIKHIFEDVDQLQINYGLQASNQNDSAVEQPQFLLNAVFRKCHARLLSGCRERQDNTDKAGHMTWAIKNQQDFDLLIADIRTFNDRLQDLFPKARTGMNDVIQQEIASSANPEQLQLLQKATIDTYKDISSAASTRLNTIATAEDWEDISEGERASSSKQDAKGIPHRSKRSESQTRLKKVQRFYEKKDAGALVLSVSGAWEHSSKVTVDVHWTGEKEDYLSLYKDSHGYARSGHAAIGLYKKERFAPLPIRKEGQYTYDDAEEASVLLAAESFAHHENINPGTVTVEGFALEAWEHEETYHPRPQNTWVSSAPIPNISAEKLLRRIKELQNEPSQFGWSLNQDTADLKEFCGDLGMQYFDRSYENQLTSQYSNLFSILNRRDMMNFLDSSSVSSEWSDQSDGNIALWNFLWQVILAKEVIRRVEHGQQCGWTSGFGPRILSSMIIANRWLKHVEIVLTDQELLPTESARAQTQKEKDQAESFKTQGNTAFAAKNFSEAIDLYSQALEIDAGNAVYRNNRSAAYYAAGKYDNSLEDAYAATRLDPMYTKAWSRIGLCFARRKLWNKSIECYEAVSLLSGSNVSEATKKALKEARDQNEAQIKAINDEKDNAKSDSMRKAFLEQDFSLVLREVQMHSLIHEQQIEGLLWFAAKMKWPYINEVRDYAEEAYSNLRAGEIVPYHLHDWLYGMTLPGQWFAHKIMTTLITCTPSIRASLGAAQYYDCGLSLARKSYWRIRTVLGRVLGCLPGVQSIGGWLGPCPAVEFEPPSSSDREPRHIRLRTRQISLLPHKAREQDDPINLGEYSDRYADTRPRDDEEIEPWMAEMTKPANWIIPESPARQSSSCEFKSIRLIRDLTQKDQTERAKSSDYRAHLIFKMDTSPDLIIYKLYTNSVFITAPPCHPGEKGAHEVHRREMHRYDKKNIWPVERLKDHTEEDTEGTDVMIINATGKGAELLARAWCSERGKHAVSRRTGGPCFVCSERAASTCGLSVGVLIWVS